MLSSAWSKAYPTRHEHAQHVSVREQSNVAIKCARPANDPIRAGADLLRSPATGTSIAEYQPAGGDLSDLAGRQSLVCAVVPLHQVVIDNGLLAEPGELAGFPRPLHWTDENKRECQLAQLRPHSLSEATAIVSQRNVGRPSVAAVQAPRGLPMPDCKHLQTGIHSCCRGRYRWRLRHSGPRIATSHRGDPLTRYQPPSRSRGAPTRPARPRSSP